MGGGGGRSIRIQKKEQNGCKNPFGKGRIRKFALSTIVFGNADLCGAGE